MRVINIHAGRWKITTFVVEMQRSVTVSAWHGRSLDEDAKDPN